MARIAPPVQIECALPTVSGAAPIEVSTSTGVSKHPASRNIWGGFVIGDVSRLHDTSDPHYLFVRVANFVAIQTVGMWKNRAATAAKFKDIIQANPRILMVAHDKPFTASPSFRPKPGQSDKHRYEYMFDNREKSITFIDNDNRDEISANKHTNTTLPAQQAGVMYNIADASAQTHFARVAADFICGTNESGLDMGGGDDLSSNVGYFFDASGVLQPKFGSANMRTQEKGTVAAIVSSNSKQPIIVALSCSSTFSLPTTGTLAEDSSFGALDNIEAIFFKPVSSATQGFLGLEAIGFKSSSAQPTLYLKSLPRQAHSTQSLTVSTGYKWNLNNRRSSTIHVDRDGDGDPEDAYSEGHTNYANGFNAFWDKLESNVETISGIKTGRGWNTGHSQITKRNRGLPVNHAQISTGDYVNNESGNEPSKFVSNNLSSGHSYKTEKVKLGEQMESMHFISQFVRPSPGGRVGELARGQMFEVEVFGENFSDINDLDATYMRFWKALTLTVPDCQMVTVLHSSRFNAVSGIEEFWIDFDTNYSSVRALGEYDPAGGNVGPSGFPTGSWTWFAAENGYGIYLRRVGNWLMAINMSVPSDYPSTYAPSHLSGGYSPRNPEDQITPAHFQALVDEGVLEQGYRLEHFNPADYINQPMTEEYGFNFGPRQSHPSDNDHGYSDYNLGNLPLIARDNTKNDGSVVNTDNNYELGPLEAVFWRIS